MIDADGPVSSFPTDDAEGHSWRHCAGRFTGPDAGQPNALEHYQKHVIVQHEWAEPDPTPDSYARRATAHLNSVQSVELFDPSTAAVVKYSIPSNELGLANHGDGHIRTFFRPSRGPDYVEDQIRSGKWLPYRFAQVEGSSLGTRLSDSANDRQAEAMANALLRIRTDLEAQEPHVVLDCQTWLHSKTTAHLASVTRFAADVSFLTAMESHARRTAASEQQEELASRICGCQHEWEGVLAALEEVAGPALSAACYEEAEAQISQLIRISDNPETFDEEEFEDVLARRDGVELLLAHLAVRCLEDEELLVRYLMLRTRAEALDHKLRQAISHDRRPPAVWEPLGEFWWRRNVRALPTSRSQSPSHKHSILADTSSQDQVPVGTPGEDARDSLLRERRAVIEALIQDSDPPQEDLLLRGISAPQIIPLDRLQEPSLKAQDTPSQLGTATSSMAPTCYVQLSRARFRRTYFGSVLIDGDELRGSGVAPDVPFRIALTIDGDSVTLDVSAPEGLVRMGGAEVSVTGIVPLLFGEVSLSIGETDFLLAVVPLQPVAVSILQSDAGLTNISKTSGASVYLQLHGPRRFRRTYFSDVVLDAHELRGSGLHGDISIRLKVSICGDCVTIETPESDDPLELDGRLMLANRAFPLPLGDTTLKITHSTFILSVARVQPRPIRPPAPALMLRLIGPPTFRRTYFEDCILGRSELRGLHPVPAVNALGERLVEIVIFEEVATIAPLSSVNPVAVNGRVLHVPEVINLPIGRFALGLGAVTLQGELSHIDLSMIPSENIL